MLYYNSSNMIFDLCYYTDMMLCDMLVVIELFELAITLLF